MNKTLVKDLARKRRQYLWRRTYTKMWMAIGVALAIYFGVLSLLCALGTSVQLFTSWWVISRGSLLLFASRLPLVVVLAATAWGSYMIAKNAERKRQVLVRVPPVVEQITALSESDLLLRGSEQPTAAPAELLRAANTSTETASTDLLRPGGNVTP